MSFDESNSTFIDTKHKPTVHYRQNPRPSKPPHVKVLFYFSHLYVPDYLPEISQLHNPNITTTKQCFTQPLRIFDSYEHIQQAFQAMLARLIPPYEFQPELCQLHWGINDHGSHDDPVNAFDELVDRVSTIGASVVREAMADKSHGGTVKSIEIAVIFFRWTTVDAVTYSLMMEDQFYEDEHDQFDEDFGVYGDYETASDEADDGNHDHTDNDTDKSDGEDETDTDKAIVDNKDDTETDQADEDKDTDKADGDDETGTNKGDVDSKDYTKTDKANDDNDTDKAITDDETDTNKPDVEHKDDNDEADDNSHDPNNNDTDKADGDDETVTNKTDADNKDNTNTNKANDDNDTDKADGDEETSTNKADVDNKDDTDTKTDKANDDNDTGKTNGEDETDTNKAEVDKKDGTGTGTDTNKANDNNKDGTDSDTDTDAVVVDVEVMGILADKDTDSDEDDDVDIYSFTMEEFRRQDIPYIYLTVDY